MSVEVERGYENVSGYENMSGIENIDVTVMREKANLSIKATAVATTVGGFSLTQYSYAVNCYNCSTISSKLKPIQILALPNFISGLMMIGVLVSNIVFFVYDGTSPDKYQLRMGLAIGLSLLYVYSFFLAFIYNPCFTSMTTASFEVANGHPLLGEYTCEFFTINLNVEAELARYEIMSDRLSYFRAQNYSEVNIFMYCPNWYNKYIIAPKVWILTMSCFECFLLYIVINNTQYSVFGIMLPV